MAGYEVVLGEVVEEHATDICRREVKLRGQQIRRDAAKAADAEVLPDARNHIALSADAVRVRPSAQRGACFGRCGLFR